jgi:hypothetical protein
MNKITEVTEYQLLDMMVGYDYWRQFLYLTPADVEVIKKLLLRNGHDSKSADMWIGEYINVIY